MRYLLLAFLTAGCAGPGYHHRGWIGGQGARVRTPDGSRAVLLTRVPEDSPSGRAGLREGDVVLEVDREPVKRPRDLRRMIEERDEGAKVAVRYRRGKREDLAVVEVGRETWERRRVLRVGIGISPRLDLWPFDDGIDVLGLIRFKKSRHRHDLTEPVRAYYDRGTQEMLDLFVLPIGVSLGKRVVAQE